MGVRESGNDEEIAHFFLNGPSRGRNALAFSTSNRRKLLLHDHYIERWRESARYWARVASKSHLEVLHRAKTHLLLGS